MSIETYTGSGTIIISGCTEINVFRNYPYLYSVGDTCFLKFKALKGKLEQVVIKEIKIVTNYQINGEIRFMYIDTLNAIYNESDLLSKYEAVQIAKQYYQHQIYLATMAKTTCTLRPQGKSSYSGPNHLFGGFA